MKKSMMVLCAVFLVFGLVNLAEGTIISVNLGNFIGQYNTTYSAWSGGNWLGKEQTIDFGWPFAPVEMFTFEFWGDVTFPQYDSGPDIINCNFNIRDTGTAVPHFNYGISIIMYMESHTWDFPGYTANFTLNGNQFHYSLTMTQDFASSAGLLNWLAGFPASEAWTGLAFMHMKNSPNQVGMVNVTGANLTISGGQPIPEPTTMFLLGFGLIGLAGFRRKFRKK